MARASITKSTQRKAASGHAKIAKRASKTHDSYQNVALALGQGTDNLLSQSTYGFNPITRIRNLLDWIYRGSWLGSIAVDIVADDMTRAGIEIDSEMAPDDADTLRKTETELNLWGCLNETIKWARLYGGAIMVMLIEGQDMETPLRIETVGKGQLKGFMVLDRWMVDAQMTELVGELGPHVGKPKFYMINSDAPALRRQRVHYSRVVRIEGMDLPYWQRVQEQLWGLSVFERIYDRMVALDSATQGAAQLVYKSFLRTFKMKGLADLLAAGGAGPDSGIAVVARRMDALRRNQSNEGISVVDSEDDIEVQSASGYTGITDVILQFIQQISGTLQIPLVRMLGQSPAGLNSSGESDLRTYYDGINQQQERVLRNPLSIVYKVMAMSLGLKLERKWNFRFRPLWQLDESQKSEISQRDATSLGEMEELGIIKKSTVLKELKQSSRTTGRFDTISEADIQEAIGEENAPEMPGLGLSDDEIKSVGGDPDNHKHENPENNPEPPQKPGQPQPPKPGQPPKPPQASANSTPNASKPSRDRARDSLPSYYVCGVQVQIENMAGTVRSGPGWHVEMPADYGFIPCVGSAEGDMEWMDCFVGRQRDSEDVWIVDMADPRTGKFDEHKCMLGFASEDDARRCIEDAYHDGAARRIISITHMGREKFAAWLRSGDHVHAVKKAA